MVEKQSAHRIEIEKNVIASQQCQETRGQFFGFIIGLVGLLCGTYAAICGHEAAGTIIGGVPLAGLVSVFLYSKHKNTEERGEKREEIEAVAPQAIHVSQPKKNKQNKRRRR